MAETDQSDFSQHLKNAFDARRRQVESLLPDGFVENGREADRETLLALSALVQGVAKRIEDMGDADGTRPKPRSARKAKVQVE